MLDIKINAHPNSMISFEYMLSLNPARNKIPPTPNIHPYSPHTKMPLPYLCSELFILDPFGFQLCHLNLAWTWGLSKLDSVHHSLRPDAYHLGGSPKWVQAERWSLKTCSVWLAKCLWLTLIWLFPKLVVKTHTWYAHTLLHLWWKYYVWQYDLLYAHTIVAEISMLLLGNHVIVKVNGTFSFWGFTVRCRVLVRSEDGQS